MKKLTLSVAALSIAMMSYGQNLNDSITMSRLEVIEILNTIGDILEWQNQDIENGETSQGFYEEKWGSNYWVTLLEEELYAKLQNEYQVDCENCDEID